MQDPASPSGLTRVRVFVDFWNFQLGLRDDPDLGRTFQLDWSRLGRWLVDRAGNVLGAPTSYEGMHVYLSYNPKKEEDKRLKAWASNVIDRMPGTHVVLFERKPKDPPTCPASDCRAPVETCPTCGGSMVGTVEKGVDTAIVTDMIRLAWTESYDAAVLVSADADFIPAVEFLSAKGLKVINGRFGARGANLSKKCWGNFPLTPAIADLRR